MGRLKETQVNRSPFASSGISHLEQAYSALEAEVGPRDAYEELLALVARGLTGKLPKGTKMTEERAATYDALLKAWFSAWVEEDELFDDLGMILELRAFATFDRLGQFLTPMNVCRMMALMNAGTHEQAVAQFKERLAEGGKSLNVYEPSCGTGRMLMAFAEVTLDWDVQYTGFAVDIDIRMVRTTIVNGILTNVWRFAHGAVREFPFYGLWANALEVELLHPGAWRAAGMWEQPHWSTLPALGSGREVAPPPAQGLMRFMEAEDAPAEPTVVPTETVEERRTRGGRKSLPVAPKKHRAEPLAPAAPTKGRQLRLGDPDG